MPSPLARGGVALMANVIEILVKAKDEAIPVLKETKKESEGLGSAITKMGVVSGVALAAVGAEAIKMATSYESATTRLVTSAGESTKNIGMVRKGMLDMAGQVGIGATDLAKGMYTVESAGYHAGEGLTVLKAAAQGAKAEGAELATVGNAVTDVLVDYHLKASDAANVTSQMITAVSHGKTSFEEFSGSMHNILPLAAAMHLSFADVAGVLAEMTAHGMSADQASQNMANAMRSLLGPTATMKAEFKAVGTSADEVHDKLSTVGLAGTLQFLAEKAKAVSPNLLDQEAAMRKLIGTAPGLQVALMTTGENAEATAAAIKDIAGSSADAKGDVKGFSEVQKTLGQQVAELKAGFESLMIELGDKLIPVVKDVVGWMNQHKTVVVDTMLALSGLAAGVAAYTLIAKGVAAATKAWSAAQKAANAVTEEGALTTGKLGTAIKGIGFAGAVVGAISLGQEIGKLAGVGDHTDVALSKLTDTFLKINDGSAQSAQQLGAFAVQMVHISQAMNDNHPMKGLQDMDQALADMVSSGHADQAKASVDAITTSLTAQGVSLGYIHDQVLPKYNDALATQANDAKEAAGSTDGLTDSTKNLADAQGSAADAVSQASSAYDAAKKGASGYLDSIDALYGKFGNLSDAQAAFTLAMDDGAASILKGRDAVDLNTKAGATNFQTFERMAKAAEDVSGKMVEQGSTTADATQALRNSAKAIDDLAKKSGLTKDQIKKLNTELFGVPDVKTITISTNADVVSQRLAALAGQIAGLSGAVGQIGKGGNAAMYRAAGGEVGTAATGGDRSGLVWVGEQGPELVRLPTGSTVRSHPDSMAALAGAAQAAPASVQIEWIGPAGDEFFAMVKRWIRIRGGTGPNSVQTALGQSW